jgi:hypothetical protein
MARSDRKRLAFAGVVAIAVPIFVACNGIIGLSDFEKVECGGRRCADGPITPANEGGVDVVVGDAAAEARGADPVSWAQWPMPNYDGGAEFLPNPLQYEIVAGDNLKSTPGTNLVWRRLPLPGGQRTLDEAKTACANLTDSGPWRLPKRIELVTLLDFGRVAPPFIDPGFTGVRNIRVWTSSELRPFAGTPAAYWTVDFGTGVVATLPASPNDVADVLCVKGK